MIWSFVYQLFEITEWDWISAEWQSHSVVYSSIVIDGNSIMTDWGRAQVFQEVDIHISALSQTDFMNDFNTMLV